MLTKVRYNPWLGIGFLSTGGLILFMALFTGIGLNIITAGILVLLGILYLLNPMLRVDEDKIQLLSPAGIKGRIYRYKEEPIKIEGEKIWIGDRRLSLNAWMAHPNDRKRLLVLLQENRDDGDISAHLVEY